MNSEMYEVNKWLNKHTYHWSDFGNVDDLIKIKGDRNIYVVLPTLNEQENVGRVVGVVKNELGDLVNRVIVVDSGSIDNTQYEAEKAGAKFYSADDFSISGSKKGKGTNLWVSLQLTAALAQESGYEIRDDDIISWVDADIFNFHKGFVCGPVGALLNDSNLHYSKCFYQRPLRTRVNGETRVQPTGGGRVTELTFRPLVNILAGMPNLNVDFKKLLALIQPLSGEYAGTREVLEQIPFYTGYSVETNHLISISKLEEFGLDAIAQVDADKRIHDNQSTLKLSDMSTMIADTLLTEAGLKEREPVEDGELREHKVTVYRPHYSVGMKYLEEKTLSEVELPPMITVPRYRRRRGLTPLEVSSI